MLHVLVNNNYQLRAFLRHFSGRPDVVSQTTLVAIPHALTLGAQGSAFGRLVVLQTPHGRRRMPWLLGSYAKAAVKVGRQLRPSPRDVLVFFTEVEWLNQIVVQRFKAAGAKVVLLEDGGFGTYVPMGQPASEALTWRQRLAQATYRLLPELRQSRLFKANGVLFPRLPDWAIDCIALYRNAPICRDVPVQLVAQPARKPFTVRPGSVIFLNEPLYDYYQDAETYLRGLARLLEALDRGFGMVHFKFHPRESAAWRNRITAMIRDRFPRIRTIESDLAVEDILVEYRPEVLASYFSSALLGIELEGVEPMYLYQLLDDLADQVVFSSTTRILRSWGYRFVERLEDVRSGYQSGLADSRSTAADLGTLIGVAPAGTWHLAQ